MRRTSTDIPDDCVGEYKSGPLAGLSPNVIRLGIISFFADVSSEMLYPLVPIFLTVTLGAPVAAVGFIEGVAESAASLMKTVSGRMSDLSGRRRPYITLGYTASAFAKPLLALAGGWPVVLFARAVDRFGKGLRSSPRDALIADSASVQCRGKAFGWHRGMDTMGAVIGPLLALALISLTNENLRLIFILAFIPGITGAAFTLTVRERRRQEPIEQERIQYRALPGPFRSYLMAWGLFAIVNSSDVFLILKAKQMGYQTTWVVILYVLYNVVYALASPVLGSLSDSLGRKKVLAGGLVVFAMVYMGFAFTSHLWQLWVLFVVYGLYIASTDGVGKAFAVDLVSHEIRATAVGIFGTITGVAALAASGVAGLLWSAVGPWAAFTYGAIGALAGAALISRVRTV